MNEMQSRRMLTQLKMVNLRDPFLIKWAMWKLLIQYNVHSISPPVTYVKIRDNPNALGLFL